MLVSASQPDVGVVPAGSARLLAVFLWEQLEVADEIQARRRAIWERYDAGLRGWAAERGVRTPIVPPHCE